MVGHLTPGEVVVPREVLAQMGTREQLRRGFAAAGADMGRFTVGGMDDSRNPATGAREYAFGDPDAPGADTPDGTDGGEGPGAEDPSEGFTGPGGLADAPSRGGPSVADAPDGGEAPAPVSLPQRATPPARPVQALPDDFENMDLAFATMEDVDKFAEAFDRAEKGELEANDILGLFGVTGNIIEGFLDKGIEKAYEGIRSKAERDPFGAMGDLRDRFGPSEPGEGGEGGETPVDTLPGGAGAPVPGVEPEADPDSPDSVFADVTPWEGVPEITQAALPEGWLGNVQGNILATHQSAARMGAW